MSLTRLTKPVVRAVGGLVVTVDADGVELRGFRKRKIRKRLTWEQIASLDEDPLSLINVAERRHGVKELKRIGVSNEVRDD